MKKFAKVLTRTDVGTNGSHQGGPLIPLGVQGVLPHPVVAGFSQSPSKSVDVKVDVSRNGRLIDTIDAAVVAHSRGFTREDETHFTGFMTLVEAKAGDVMVVGKKTSRRFTVNIVPKRHAKSIKSQLGGKRCGFLS